eukprot:COSAG05_NODE_908_length_6643_cov_2.923441_8_plen_305_part_00
MAGSESLGELGWQGVHKYDSPDVAALRQQLDSAAGIQGVEIIDPAADADFATHAAAIFHRDGFVLVKDCLEAERLEMIREGCENTIRKMVELDPRRLGNRGSHRYSFGHAPHHFGCANNWASALVDPPRVLAVLEAIFGSPDFHLHDLGGDYVLPGCVEYQHLHRDLGDFLDDPRGQLDFRDLPVPEVGGNASIASLSFSPPRASLRPRTHLPFCRLPAGTWQVACNFPMEVVPGSTVGHTLHNGVTRQICGTQNSRQPIPDEDTEPLWMKLAVTAPGTSLAQLSCSLLAAAPHQTLPRCVRVF